MTRQARITAPEGQRGVALVLVLWIVAILSLLAAGFAQVTRLEARRVSNTVAAAEARALLEEGLARAMLSLLGPDPADRPRPDGAVHTLALAMGSVGIAITDEGGKVDLNAAPDAVIEGLFGAVDADGDGSRLAAAVLDWRDADSQRRPGGAEAADYAGAEREGPGNRPFLSTAELATVLGVTPALWRRVAPHVTVHGGARVNAATADPLLLRALPGLSEGDAAQGQPDGGPVYTIGLTVRTIHGAVAAAEVVVMVSDRGARPFRRLEWRQPPEVGPRISIEISPGFPIMPP